MKNLFLLFSLCILWNPEMTRAQLRLPEIFGDHMVLQRDLPVPVWGSGLASGQKVRVKLGKHSVQAVADANGAWKTELPPMKAGGPYVLRISTGKKELVFKDVLIGEVWLCSGQSNMAWPLMHSEGFESLKTSLDRSQLRLFKMEKDVHIRPKAYTETELERVLNGKFYQAATWQHCTAESAPSFSAVAYHFGTQLLDSLKVPIGLIQNAIGGSPTQAWISKEALQAHPQLCKYAPHTEGRDWFSVQELHPFVVERVKKNLGMALENGQATAEQHPFSPAYLYTQGIAPLLPYAIRGVIWYQGESNANHPEEHQALFEALIRNWRKDWQQGDFPFLYVQLPGISDRNRWPEFRALQKETLRLPNTGMAVTIELGHPTDVHPRKKQPVGERLSRIALAKIYGFELEYSGPTVSAYRIKDQKLYITFEHARHLTTSGGEALKGLVLQGYEKNGTQEVIRPVTQVQLEGNRLILSVPEELSVTKVKYAWAPFPECNLINEAGLPASPFCVELPGNF
ncbi:sialate O-acetylesterase [Rapidithrix thailandica]|uniref:Sialate O-acetylesterase n=1 Tax=Rapidithrix thailandica TaxID=413964 RepID=A0AAW9SDU4_9BACT